jgi:aromatic ring-opening dioxygenase catalytic subunit (LigB family)
LGLLSDEVFRVSVEGAIERVLASLFHASASSSPTCHARPSGSSPSTTSAGRAIKEGKGAIIISDTHFAVASA